MTSAKRRFLWLLMSAVTLSATLEVATALASETEMNFYPYGLGQESCEKYLSDIAGDQSIQQLYSAWLAGYVTVVEAQIPDAPAIIKETEMGAANAWITNYCVRRASDTYLTATVRLIAARERSQ